MCQFEGFFTDVSPLLVEFYLSSFQRERHYRCRLSPLLSSGIRPARVDVLTSSVSVLHVLLSKMPRMR
jgi:hypothetical protein